jgi:hypothetical protein
VETALTGRAAAGQATVNQKLAREVGRSVSAERGEQLPHGPLGFGWRFSGEERIGDHRGGAAQATLYDRLPTAPAQPAAAPKYLQP